MSFERYHEAVDYLQRRLWHELPIVPVERALQSRIRTLLAHVGDPHTRFPVVHVGGSAGKGSTATIAASLLQAAGLRTGLYTSPHLQTFIERIDVDGTLIAPERFADLVLGLDPLVRKMHIEVLDGVGFGRPSLVEVAFAVAMKHFADEQIDVAVIEVGLGGRTDYTNVFDEHIAASTILTNIEYEHTERLGATLKSIAREKSAIIHGGPVVTGAMRADALRVIEERCAETDADLRRLGREIKVRPRGYDRGASTFDVVVPDRSLRNLRLPLSGAHQQTNAALAIAVLLRTDTARALWDDPAAIQRGLDAVRLNCRLEVMQQDPVVLLDGAHNPVEARRVADALSTHYLRDGARAHLVVGILADKDQAAMVRQFARVASSVTVTQPPLGERIGDPDRMLHLFERALGAANVTFEPSPERALDRALADTPRDGIVCVTGSMFLVGALRNRWLPEQTILERRSAAFAPDDA
ncbi:MAG TPA: Mur ligase family protein [Dehalococcoidia bacterium]